MELASLILLIALFLCIGSFSSVVIYRLISMEFSNTNINLFSPRSHCPNCKKNISFVHLIPLVGYLLQKARCVNCKEIISYKYPLYELMHLITGLFIYINFGINLMSALIYILFSMFYILFECDLQKLFLPFYLNILISIFGFSIAFNGAIFHIESFGIIGSSQFILSIYGFIGGYFILWFINICYKFFKKKDGIGGGDFLLLGGIGSLVGPFSLAPIIFIGSISTLLLTLTPKLNTSSELPLGSGLIVGLGIYLLARFFELSLHGLVI
ncbi:MAG: prepilin peptidase [Proteobacteria bacterium]|nr:prepilin peptidase [Pseudomonadota bacterium]